MAQPRAPLTPLSPREPLAPRRPLEPLTPRLPLTRGRTAVLVPPAEAEPEPPSYLADWQRPAATTPPPVSPPPRRPRVPVPGIPAGRRRPKSNTAAAVIAVAVALIVGLVAIGSRTSSGGGQPVVVSIATPSFGGFGSSGPTSGSSTGGEAAASLGQSRTLNGSIAGETVRVRFTRWVDDARANSSIFAAGPGKRYVAAQFRITNTGTIQYVDSPFNGAAVVDRAGRNYRAAFLVDGIREGRVFDAAVSIATGASATGFIVFEVPVHAKIRQVQFSESSGFGQTGDWSING